MGEADGQERTVKDLILSGGLSGHRFSTRAYNKGIGEPRVYIFVEDGLGSYYEMGQNVAIARIEFEGKKRKTVDLGTHLDDPVVE